MPEGTQPVRAPLERPITSSFFAATPRSGNRLTEAADLLIADTIDDKPVPRYARIRFLPLYSARSPSRASPLLWTQQTIDFSFSC